MTTTNKDGGRARRTVGWETVTPEQAKAWLGESVNDANRHIRKKKVEQYARDMANGDWTESNDAISLDEDGKLLNGQHRLSAIVAHGKPVELLVARGLPRGSQLSMDSGVPRQFGDHLKMSGGMPNATSYASLSRQMFLLESDVHQSGQVSRAEQQGWLEQNADDAHSAVAASRAAYRYVDANVTALAMAHILVSRVNGPALADHYLAQLARPAGEPDGSAVFAVTSRFYTSRRTGQRLRVRQHLSLLVRGWNHWAVGNEVRMLQMTGEDTRVPAVVEWTRMPL